MLVIFPKFLLALSRQFDISAFSISHPLSPFDFWEVFHYGLLHLGWLSRDPPASASSAGATVVCHLTLPPPHLPPVHFLSSGTLYTLLLDFYSVSFKSHLHLCFSV